MKINTYFINKKLLLSKKGSKIVDTIFLRIAKSVILSKFDDSYILDKEALVKKYPFLNKMGAAFVTLEYEHQLRGCIGSIVAHRKLLDDIIHNARSAAFSDHRFNPLKHTEFPQLTLEVSILSEPEVLDYNNFQDLVTKVIPKEDGLILQHDSYQGTFLPQVWEQIPDAKEFLEHLSIKSGASPSIYEEHPNIYRYRVDAIKDKFDDILPI